MAKNIVICSDGTGNWREVRILTKTSHIVFPTTPDEILDTSRAGSPGHNNSYTVTFVSVQALKCRQPKPPWAVPAVPV